MTIENVKLYTIESNSLVSPSYAICTAYRDESKNLHGESFFIWVPNEGSVELYPVDILFKDYANKDCPFVIDESRLIDEALGQAKLNHNLKVFKLNEGKSAQHWWPTQQSIVEIELEFLVRLWLRNSIKKEIEIIGQISKVFELRNFIAQFAGLGSLSFTPMQF